MVDTLDQGHPVRVTTRQLERLSKGKIAFALLYFRGLKSFRLVSNKLSSAQNPLISGNSRWTICRELYCCQSIHDWRIGKMGSALHVAI